MHDTTDPTQAVPKQKSSTTDIYKLRMWDMSVLIRRCENVSLFYSFCSLVVDAESQTRDQDVSRHIDVRTFTFLEGLLLSRRIY